MSENESGNGTPPGAPAPEGERVQFEEAPTDPGRAEASSSGGDKAGPSTPPSSAPSSAPAGATPSAPPAPPPDPLAEAKAQAFEFKDKYLRMAADLDNFRKRARRENEDAERRGRENLLRDLLPVFDNLERAASAANAATDAKAVADGVRMVVKQFEGTLERIGITRVVTSGVAFDPNLHEAIQHQETTDQAPGTVVAEVQAGYQMGERLVRAAMVVVAKAPVS